MCKCLNIGEAIRPRDVTSRVECVCIVLYLMQHKTDDEACERHLRLAFDAMETCLKTRGRSTSCNLREVVDTDLRSDAGRAPAMWCKSSVGSAYITQEVLLVDGLGALGDTELRGMLDWDMDTSEREEGMVQEKRQELGGWSDAFIHDPAQYIRTHFVNIGVYPRDRNSGDGGPVGRRRVTGGH